MTVPLNAQIAGKLEEMADLLQHQAASAFRIGAYRRAASTVLGLPRDLAEILEAEGQGGLVALPDIGKGIAAAIAEIVTTGRWAQLERLRGTLDPEPLFRTVPGIGTDLAHRIHETLQIDTLEALEAAAYDGRLRLVAGIGPRRLAALRAALSQMLQRTRRPTMLDTGFGPDVALLLEIDRRYRDLAQTDRLPRIAPRRFNPQGEAWLPVLHAEQAGWHFTVMYSNTARAHELGRTRDWVVVYFYDDHHREGQHTLVTETRGPLQGRRVVRGREGECRTLYDREEAPG